MRVGVVIPTRLAPRPGGLTLRDFGPELWLDGALASVRAQIGYSDLTWEIFVGTDPGALVPLHVYDHAHVVKADRPGQSAAVNAAAAVAVLDSDLLFFLEDDDRWHKTKFIRQVEQLENASFVSCSQQEVSSVGEILGRCDYPTPSTWLMRSEVWKRVGGFDEGTRWLVDTEWLGRLNALGIPRIHLVEKWCLDSPNRISYVARHSQVVPCGHDLLVYRAHNEQGGMETMKNDLVKSREADEEASNIRRRFGCDPW